MTGGIAAYKVCELVRRLQDEGAEVQVVMTAAAREFVTATTMQALTGQPVFTDQWGDGAQVGNAMPHIDLTRGVDAIVVAPGDRTLHRQDRARTGRRPALDAGAGTQPGDHGAAGRAGDERRDVGEPGDAAQCRAAGRRRRRRCSAPPPATRPAAKSAWAACSSLLTCSRTSSRFSSPSGWPEQGRVDRRPDRSSRSIRYACITNLSSGKTGFALARAAAEAGADVTLVAGPTTLPTPASCAAHRRAHRARNA